MSEARISFVVRPGGPSVRLRGSENSFGHLTVASCRACKWQHSFSSTGENDTLRRAQKAATFHLNKKHRRNLRPSADKTLGAA